MISSVLAFFKKGPGAPDCKQKFNRQVHPFHKKGTGTRVVLGGTRVKGVKNLILAKVS